MTDMLPPSPDRSLATFVLLAYNQQNYIRRAIEGAFSQNFKQLEIILSDDFSTDHTYDIMSKMAAEYDGPHRVVLNRNNCNLGLVGHFNKVLEMASSEIIVLAAGDDVSLPDRVSLTSAELLIDPSVQMISLGHTLIDDEGKKISSEINACGEIASIAEYFSDSGIHPNGASRGFKKAVFSKFGAMDSECPTEDTTSLLRALILGKVKLVPKQGVLYRKHGGNLSRPSSIVKMNLKALLGQYLSDIDRAGEQGYLNGSEVKSAITSVTQNVLNRQVKTEMQADRAPSLWKLYSAAFRGKFTIRSRVSMIWHILQSIF